MTVVIEVTIVIVGRVVRVRVVRVVRKKFCNIFFFSLVNNFHIFLKFLSLFFFFITIFFLQQENCSQLLFCYFWFVVNFLCASCRAVHRKFKQHFIVHCRQYTVQCTLNTVYGSTVHGSTDCPCFFVRVASQNLSF